MGATSAMAKSEIKEAERSKTSSTTIDDAPKKRTNKNDEIKARSKSGSPYGSKNRRWNTKRS
jgi:hypothetical protein